jgi:3-deoxy-manno-octulosonate cytidylyltransferase (CMP-KDO synthetase)
MTDPSLPSGTDRCFEAFKILSEDFGGIINIQGDEPFIAPKSIEKVANLIRKESEIATLCCKIKESDYIFDTNKVKVVFDRNGRALYFSRQAIPYQRGVAEQDWVKNTDYFLHLGIYGFNAKIINDLRVLKPSKLENLEALEQLRWLENGFQISVDQVDSPSFGVDTPEDLVSLNLKLKKGEILL